MRAMEKLSENQGKRPTQIKDACNRMMSRWKRRTGLKTQKKLILMAAALLGLLVGTHQIAANAQHPPVTKDNLAQLITDARTPADHEAIAAFYQQEAADENKTAELHQTLADTYRKLKIPKPVYMAEMCDNMAADFRKTATDANKLAAMHEQMAKQAESK